MRFFIMGATGFVGTNLINYLSSQGHYITIITRRDTDIKLKNIDIIKGNPLNTGDWQEKASDCEVIINLIGRPIFTKWTEEAKREILESRVKSAEMAVNTMEKSKSLKVLVNANAIGYYGITGERDVTEDFPMGNGFLADVSKKWQDTAMGAEKFGKRVVVARFAPVLGKNGGMMKEILPIFRLGLGGRIGDGNQWFSWIHIIDLCRAMEFVSMNDNIKGPVNFTSPNPIRNKDFTKALSTVLGKPAILPVPSFALKMIMGDVASLSLDSVKVLPKVLLDYGFKFSYPDILSALREIVD